MNSKRKFDYEEEDAQRVAKYLKVEPDVKLTFNELPECHNVVCQASFGKPIDQMWLLREFPNADFKRGRFPAVTQRIRPPPGSTHLLFNSGRLMIMGMHSSIHACYSYQMQRREFIQHGRPDYGSFPIQLENCVYSFHAPYCIHISKLKHEDSLGFITVPELFPGGIYRMLKPAVAMLIFESGSLMILGVRDDSDLTAALESILPVLQKHAYYPDSNQKGGGRGSSRKKGERVMDKREEKIIKAAINNIKYAPVRNKAEFDRKLSEEIAALRKKAPKTAASATSQPKIIQKQEEIFTDMPDL